jgi:hypothetical protein
MNTAFHSSSTPPRNRRGLVLSLLTGIVAASLGMPAQAQSSMAGNWSINGNGYPGGLGLNQGPNGELSGTIYNGDDVFGFHSTGSRIAVLLRGPQHAPTQAFVGDIDASGNEWRGKFYALTAGMGANATRNTFGFRAVRGSAPYVYYGDPALGPAAVNCLVPNFTVNNRPSEFPAWTFALTLTNPSPPFGCISGEFTGSIAGDPIYGHYAPGSGSIVFVRMNGGLPAQLYYGQVSGGALFSPQRITGSFYALTGGMGASSTRMRYDWAAQ